MKFYRNILLFALLFSILFSCKQNIETNPNTECPACTEQEKSHAETLSQNFQYANSKEINAKYKALLQKYDNKMRVPMKNAILHTFTSGHLPKNIEQEAFDKGFIKSGNVLLWDNLWEFMANPNMEFEDHELEPLFIRAIEHGKKKGKF